jgi:putative sterol carrier protein
MSAAKFFSELGHRGHERLLEEVSGTIRFDIEHEHGIDHWHITIDKGDVQVSKQKRDADAIVRTNRALFDRLARGEANGYAAWTRGELRIEGNLVLARLFQRILPGPPGARHPRMLASPGRR